MNFKIRKALPEDFPSILEMVHALAEFEQEPDKVTNTIEQMLAEQEYFECFVAVDKKDLEIIGFCLYYFVYYTWVGKSMYLDDLYVKEAKRGMGVGSELLKTLFKTAKENNCKRLRWQVLDWNTNAIALYEKLGADIQKNWLNCDLEHEAILQMGDH